MKAAVRPPDHKRRAETFGIEITFSRSELTVLTQ